MHEPTSKRLIIGSGRSGTTWVLDCLAEANRLRPVFEPLHPFESQLAFRYAHGVMSEGDTDSTLEGLFLDLSAGKVRSRWIDYRSAHWIPLNRHAEQISSVSYVKRWLHRQNLFLRSYFRLRAAVRRNETLIKCIRANLMAGWLSRSLGFRVALIIRHPCAVVESQYRLKSGLVWNPDPILKRYRSDAKLHRVTGGRYLEIINEPLSTLEALTLNWIIENQWPAEQGQAAGYSVVHYEDLLLRPEAAWQYLSISLGLERIPDSGLMRRPSQQSSDVSTLGGATRKPKWQSRLTTDELRMIQNMLDRTECHLYDVGTATPTTDGLAHGGTSSRSDRSSVT